MGESGTCFLLRVLQLQLTYLKTVRTNLTSASLPFSLPNTEYRVGNLSPAMGARHRVVVHCNENPTYVFLFW